MLHRVSLGRLQTTAAGLDAAGVQLCAARGADLAAEPSKALSKMNKAASRVEATYSDTSVLQKARVQAVRKGTLVSGTSTMPSTSNWTGASKFAIALGTAVANGCPMKAGSYLSRAVANLLSRDEITAITGFADDMHVS